MGTEKSKPPLEDIPIGKRLGELWIQNSSQDSITPPLPPVRHSHLRRIRHHFLAVYQRLFSLAFLGNVAALVLMAILHPAPTLPSIAALATPIAVNLFVAGLFRTEAVINFLYTSVLWVPQSWPLGVRRRIAKIYEFGGVHSGAGIACALWAVLFVVQLTRGYVAGEPISIAAVIVTYCLVSLLAIIIIAAYPRFRQKHHNHFEALHRFAGWASLLLYWALVMLLTRDISQTFCSSFAKTLFISPIIYFLIGSTVLTILPWLRLRRVDATIDRLSSHAARIYFSAPSVGPAQGIRISTSPLMEWHSFASIPCIDMPAHLQHSSNIVPSASKPTVSSSTQTTTAVSVPVRSARVAETKRAKYSILVSHAGDWTKAAISSPLTTRRYWIRGIPITGIALVVRLFRRAVVVTTGSGIGPVLSLVAATRHSNNATNGSNRRRLQKRTPTSESSLEKDLEAGPPPPPGLADDDYEASSSGRRGIPLHIIWSTRSPGATYGPGVLDEVYGADPTARIIETRKGEERPDLVAETWKAVHAFVAEAVVVISNPVLTAQVVFEMESRGIPAYGPVFDS